MNFHIITIFPELFSPLIENGLIAKAVDTGEIAFNLIDPRDFTTDKHRSVDDDPYGGGGGMVMKPGPIIRAYESIQIKNPDKSITLFPTPRGKVLEQKDLMDFSVLEDIIIICGRYKDIDHRVVEIIKPMEISIGDYVIQGGEVPAMAIIEGTTRLLPDFLGDFDSAQSDSFWGNIMIAAPSYTRPRVFRGLHVPEILLSGNHAAIDAWKIETGRRLTHKYRPDLLDD